MCLYYYFFQMKYPLSRRLTSTCLRKMNIPLALMFSAALVMTLSTTSYVLASATSNFAQTINAGTLSVDIVDGSYVAV